MPAGSIPQRPSARHRALLVEAEQEMGWGMTPAEAASWLDERGVPAEKRDEMLARAVPLWRARHRAHAIKRGLLGLVLFVPGALLLLLMGGLVGTSTTNVAGGRGGGGAMVIAGAMTCGGIWFLWDAFEHVRASVSHPQFDA